MKNKKYINLARELRQNQTNVEKLLWYRLRNKQLAGTKFRRQQRIGNYIVDFIAFDKKLIIELDGGQHNEKLAKEKDDTRTKWLQNEGYVVLRFWNNEIIENLEGVLEIINSTLTLTLSPQGRGNYKVKLLPSRERE